MQLQRQNKKKEALMIYRVYKCSESKANELRGQVVNLEQIVERIESHPLEVQVRFSFRFLSPCFGVLARSPSACPKRVPSSSHLHTHNPHASFDTRNGSVCTPC